MQFEVEVDVDAQLFDERTDDALEKFIDRDDGEMAVIVQYSGARFPGPPTDRVGGQFQVAHQFGQVSVRRAASQAVDLADDPLFHLLGSLVGKGDGEDMPVASGIANHVADIGVGQLVGFTGTGRSFQDFDISHVTKKRLYALKV